MRHRAKEDYMKWYAMHFSEQQIASGLAGRIHEGLQQNLLAHAANQSTLREMAAFVSPFEEPNADGSETYYLSPGLAAASPRELEEGKAIPCNPPSRENNPTLGVLVSWDDDEAAWEILRSRS